MDNIINVQEDINIVKIPTEKIHVNDWNPNSMDDRMFNRLVEDAKNIGFLQPILVTPEEDGNYRIIDGEHRYEVAKLLDLTEIPCVVVEGELAKDETKQKFQTMRMNMIRGKIDKSKLRTMVSDLVNTMPMEELAESMAYDDVDGLKALIADARKSLPPDMVKEFDKGKGEIKSVNDLTLILNKLFTKYGSTLPYNFMYFDFGGREHIWVRMPMRGLSTVKKYASLAQEHKVTFSSVVLEALKAVKDDEFYIKHAAELEAVYETENHNDQHAGDAETTKSIEDML